MCTHICANTLFFTLWWYRSVCTNRNTRKQKKNYAKAVPRLLRSRRDWLCLSILQWWTRPPPVSHCRVLQRHTWMGNKSGRAGIGTKCRCLTGSNCMAYFHLRVSNREVSNSTSFLFSGKGFGFKQPSGQHSNLDQSHLTRCTPRLRPFIRGFPKPSLKHFNQSGTNQYYYCSWRNFLTAIHLRSMTVRPPHVNSGLDIFWWLGWVIVRRDHDTGLWKIIPLNQTTRAFIHPGWHCTWQRFLQSSTRWCKCVMCGNW